MAIRAWQQVKTSYCQRVEKDVALEVDCVLPEGILSGEAPHILGHRCSDGMNCNLDERVACVWAGNNPVYDPFCEPFCEPAEAAEKPA